MGACVDCGAEKRSRTGDRCGPCGQDLAASTILTPEQKAKHRAACQARYAHRAAVRPEAMRFCDEGVPRNKVAVMLGIPKGTVAMWWQRYLANGRRLW